MPQIHIREAKKSDVPFILQMIKALAEYERAPQEVTITEAQLLADGFSVSPHFNCLILESDEKPVGFALFYYRYSTWKGKTLFLEDLFVQPEYRGLGLGKKAMIHIAGIAEQTGCVRFEWQVLDWNQPAIDFYKSLGAALMPEWVTCRLDRQGLERLAKV